MSDSNESKESNSNDVTAMEEVLSKALRIVTPSKNEQDTVQQITGMLLEYAQKACQERKLKPKSMLVGSVARGSWLPDRHDFDLFILFNEDVSREELEREGHVIGKRIYELLSEK